MILSTIWVAAQNAWENYRVYRTNQQLIKVVQNIREYYMSSQTLPYNQPTPCGWAGAGYDIYRPCWIV